MKYLVPTELGLPIKISTETNSKVEEKHYDAQISIQPADDWGNPGAFRIAIDVPNAKKRKAIIISMSAGELLDFIYTARGAIEYFTKKIA